MRNCGKTWLVLSLSMWILLSTSVSALDDDSDVPCPDTCACHNYGLGTNYNCIGMLSFIRLGEPEYLCDSSIYDCSEPPGERYDGDSVHLEIRRCAVTSPLHCVLPIDFTFPKEFIGTGVTKLIMPDLLTPLDEVTLQGLRMLESLVIEGNGLGMSRNETDMHGHGIFRYTPLLSTIEVNKYSNEMRLDERVMSPLLNLKNLYVFEAWKLVLGPKALSNLPSLWQVVLRESNITELPEDVFYGSKELSYLDLSINGLTFLPDQVFLDQNKMKRLAISNNKLEKVTKKLFAPLLEVTEIYLDGNRIMALPDFLFSSKSLKVISFAGNRIENITAHTFAGNRIENITEFGFLGLSVTKLDLSHNMLSWNCSGKSQKNQLGNSVLANLLDLAQLDLSHNRIQSMCNDWMQVSEQLDLSYNQLESLTIDKLNFSIDTVKVNFTNNIIKTVSPLHLPTDSRVFFDLGSNPFNCNCQLYSLLTSPNIKKNYILTDAQCSQPQSLKNVSVLKFADQKRLDSLTCSVDGSENCECLFRPNQHRIECSCEDTKNITLPKSTFDEISVMKLKLLKSQPDLTGLPSFVTILDLSGLGLKSIPDIPNTVRELVFRNNSLQIIPTDIYNKSYTLLLENNPLQCDCSEMDNVRNLQIYYQKIVDYSELLCSDGFVVKGKDPNTLCHVYYTTVIGVSCSVGAMILAITVVLMYKYLPEVQVLLYHIGLSCLVKEEWIDRGKIYDIFLSYSVKDEHFVRGTLLPKLEEMKYKVCEHTRDWEIGMQIPEQIYTSVANSKKTLFVISKHFLKSVWVLVEFDATILQGAKDRRNRAVSILLEDVNLVDAPIIIKRHITLNTYIKWDATDNSFWKRLQNALPKKLTAEEIKKRQKAVKAVKSLGTGSGLVLNEEGRLVNAALQRTISSPSATPDIVDLGAVRQST